jgi:HTH-type transcriptional regulator, sugar sensing transcriptional regulator
LNNEILIERLKSLGFKEYESKVLIVLLSGNPMSASDIAKEAKIIRNSIYDILKSFVEKGYCNEIETNTILNYQIIDPAVILDKITSDHKRSFNRKMENLAETFGELQTIYKAESAKVAAPDKSIQLIRGFNKHRVSRYVELVNSSRKEILGMYSPRRVVVDELSQDAKKFIKDGGVIRSIYQLGNDAEANEELVKACELFAKGGEEVRLADFNVPNITIFDSENVFINLSTEKNVPKHKQADLIIKNADHAGHMKDLFMYYWGKSQTIGEFIKGKK